MKRVLVPVAFAVLTLAACGGGSESEGSGYSASEIEELRATELRKAEGPATGSERRSYADARVRVLAAVKEGADGSQQQSIGRDLGSASMRLQAAYRFTDAASIEDRFKQSVVGASREACQGAAAGAQTVWTPESSAALVDQGRITAEDALDVNLELVKAEKSGGSGSWCEGLPPA